MAAGEQLKRDWTPQKQPPRMPPNIIRHPLTLIPPMVPIKDQEYEREGDDPVETVPEFAGGDDDEIEMGWGTDVPDPPDSGMQRLLDAVSGHKPDEQGEAYCLSCGYADLDGGRKVCPDCGDELYDPRT